MWDMADQPAGTELPPPPPPPPADPASAGAGWPTGPFPTGDYAWSPAPPPTGRRRWLPIAAVAAVVVVAAAVGVPIGLLARGNQSPSSSAPTPSGAPSSAAASQASALYREALAATRQAAGFHYVADTVGLETQHVVGDAGASGGTQAITFDSTYGSEQFNLVLVGQTVYFQGNTPAIEDQLGVSAAKAPSLDGQWVSVSPGDGPYTVLQPGITTADQAQEMTLVPTSMTPFTASGGVSAIRLTGTVPPQGGAPAATGHLDITAGSHEPITYVEALSAAGRTVTSTTSFTRWGTAPAVAAPSGAVAWSTLGASQPPGGYGSGGGANAAPTQTPQGI